jgi:hypothetical protein|tara:strand:+ start:377 stop:583 length:207 start_codon:yes stop_codon:yes gene_type:complete
MDKPAYRKAYMANLKQQNVNNKKNEVANKGRQGNPATQQYMKNSGQPITGISTFDGSSVLAKGSNIRF